MTVKQQLLELLDGPRPLWVLDPEGAGSIDIFDEALQEYYRALDESRRATEIRLRKLFLKLRFYERKTLRVS